MKKNNAGRLYIGEMPNFIALFITGFIVTSVSPILIEMSSSLSSVPETVILVISYYMLGSFCGMAISPFLSTKVKRLHILLTAYSAAVPIVAVLIFTNSVTVFHILYFFIGFCMSIIWIQVNASMVESRIENKSNVVNMGYIAYALSAIVGPIVSSTLARFGINWRYLYLITIIFLVSNIVFFLALRRNIDISPPKDKVVSFKALFNNKKVNIYLLLTTIITFLYVLTEAIVISWAPTFFRLYRFFDVQSAGLMMTFLWIGIVVGRVFISFFTSRMRTGYILVALSVISILSLAMVTFSQTELMSFVAIFFTGLGFSGIIPLLVSSAGKVFEKNKEVAITILFIVPQLSFSLAPYLATTISRVNVVLSLGITVLFMFLAMVMIVVRMVYRRNALK